MADDQQPLVAAGGQPLEDGTHPTRYVGPALATGWAVVELAEVGPPLRLLGKPCLDPVAGEPVQHPEITLAQSLVTFHLDIPTGLVDREPGGLQRPLVR